MHRLLQHLILCGTSLLVWACAAESDDRMVPLQETLKTVDADPKQALQTLEGIPYPESLDKDSYMQYIVLLTQARYMNDQNITNDSQILEAQRYFSDIFSTA